MKIDTHKRIDQGLCGTPVALADGYSRVELTLTSQMAADVSGLTHGGFVFGLADYAAMIAVNHPNVVLGAADVKFLKPLQTGETVIAEAKVMNSDGKRRTVDVTVFKDESVVFRGGFTCFVLDDHVLA